MRNPVSVLVICGVCTAHNEALFAPRLVQTPPGAGRVSMPRAAPSSHLQPDWMTSLNHSACPVLFLETVIRDRRLCSVTCLHILSVWLQH